MAATRSDTPSRDELVTYAQEIAQEYGIDPNIFVAQIEQESHFDPNARNASGASGIAQLMPQYYPNTDPFDPYAALEAAALTDRQNLKAFGGDYSLMLAAYNAGPGAVRRAGGIPDYPETKRYVYNILGAAQQAAGTRPGGNYLQGMLDSGGNPVAGASSSGKPDFSGLSAAEIATAIGNDWDSSSIDTNSSPSAPYSTDPNAQPPAGFQGGISPGGYGQQAWQGLVQLHGGVVSYGASRSQTVVDPTDPLRQRTIKKPVTGSPILVTFADGTTALANLIGSDDPEKATGAQVLPFAGAGGGAAKKPDVQQFPDGSLRQYQSESDTWKMIAPPPDPTDRKTPRTITLADGRILQYNWDTKSWDQIAQGVKSPITQKFPDGSLHQYNPDTGNWDQISPPDDNANQEAQLRIATAQRALMPQQQKMFSDAYDKIDAVSKAWANKQITSQERDSLIDEVHQGLQAALAGTTLFEQYKQQQDDKYRQAQEASTMLQNRVTNGTALGRDLLSAAAGHVLMPAGQSTLGIDPYAIAKAETTDLGGGAGVYDNAASTLKNFFASSQASPYGGGSAPPPGGNGIVPAGGGGQQAAPDQATLQTLLLNALRGRSMDPPADTAGIPQLSDAQNPQGPTPLQQQALTPEGPSILNALLQAMNNSQNGGVGARSGF